MLRPQQHWRLRQGETDKIDISIKSVKGSIFGDEIATYDVTITNNFIYEEQFRLAFSDDVEWVIQTDPLSYKFTGFTLARKNL
jgi:uncharacterized Zn finger protein